MKSRMRTVSLGSRFAVQDILKVGEGEKNAITGELLDGSWFGGEDRICAIKMAE